MFTASPLPIANRACLFLDDRFVAEQRGLQRVWHQAQPIPDAIIQKTEPWEDWVHIFGSALYDPQDRLYKMWYQNTIITPKEPPKPKPFWDRAFLCYAESEDGVHWNKPKFRLPTLEPWPDANILLPHRSEACSVLLNPHPRDERERFLMAIWCSNNYQFCASPDGISWAAYGEMIKKQQVQGDKIYRIPYDTQSVMWDAIRNQFFCTHRTFCPYEIGTLAHDETVRRCVGAIWNDEFLEPWTEPIPTVLAPDSKDDEMAARWSRNDKPSWAELYCMPAWTCGNHYIGLVSVLNFVNGEDSTPGTSSVQLTYSHDGMKWHRQPDRADSFARDEYSVDEFGRPMQAQYVATMPVEIGDQTIIYYTEVDSPHPYYGSRSHIRGAIWRKEGFVSLQAGSNGGDFTTPLLEFTSSKSKWDTLQLNYQTFDNGYIRVEAVDEIGKPLSGFGFDNCIPLQGNSTAARVLWKNELSLMQLEGKAVHLKFEMRNASLWSFSLNSSRASHRK